MQNTIQLTATPRDAGLRLDTYLAALSELSRARVIKLIEEGAVTVGGRAVAKNYKLREGDLVEMTCPEAEPYEAVAQDIPLDVVYEDEYLIVVNKPVGMVVHPAPGNPDGTLVNALLYHCGDSLSGIGGVMRPGIVHRIDKDTSGLLVVAKTDAAHTALAEQIKEHRVSRIYHAVVLGNLREESGTVDAPIGRHPVDRKRMAVIRNADLSAKEAVTHYTVLRRFGAFTYVRCQLETGRTHQIRVHMASLGHPLLGDEVYKGNHTRFEAVHKRLIQGQCLHAKELDFTHPITGKAMHFETPLPENMQALLDILEKTSE